MRRYALIFTAVAFGVLVLFAGFNLLVDPFAVSGAPRIAGFNAEKTRLYQDGGRIYAADALARGSATSFILGSSRTVDGFPAEPENWPGGIVNAGMRGTNMFELARAMMLAARDPDLRCLVIGIDLDEFGTHSKSKASFAISALADGNRPLSLLRTALSPNTFAASVLTVADNLAGNGPDTPWADQYEPGVQRGRYESGARGIYSYYLGYHYDGEREWYFNSALSSLTRNGVQVVAFIHPYHAWREEALFRAGREDAYFALRRDLADLFATQNDRQAANPCIDGGAAVLWDFSGFQGFATRPAPSSDATDPHETFYEPSHYLPDIGQAMLDRMRGEPGSETLFGEPFGLRLTRETARESEADIRARREAWLQTPDGQAATAFLDQVIAGDPAPESPPPQFLNRDDWNALERRAERLPDRGEAG
ncbi:hypothetical protein [Hyphobacterium marinum]|uniref:Uncharacterized protein n=1 Tax=Hyphobacterium marinum TaxID=3116574 RepID=A0ABU7LUJ7_9PROT|nr:hypothetical protein [Hyphobacterium sp. Y6023]MEE2565228.1 hypothetical protein [Hyphobacterium sp. Y6023]